MSDPFPPRSTGNPPRAVEITGKLMPWDPRSEQPILFQMFGSPAYYLPCFTTEDDLRIALKGLDIQEFTIKVIQDGPDFLSGLPSIYEGQHLHVILDIVQTETGSFRFRQVVARS